MNDVPEDGSFEAVPPEGESPLEAARCLICGGCIACGERSPCVPCVCSGVDGEQIAICDRGGDGHGGRRYVWTTRSAYGEMLLQQYCEAHMIFGKKRAAAAGIASWARAPYAKPRAWQAPA